LAVTEVFFPDEGNGSAGVVVIRPGRDPLDVDTDSLYSGEPTWAPDNQRIALIGDEYVGTLYIARVGRPGSKPVDRDPLRESRDDEAAPAWSPDGKTIAFVDETRPGFGLFVIAPDATGRRQLTDKPAHHPSWSPDSREIVFDDGHDLAVIKADGTGLRRLTTTKVREFKPAWSPDGRQIAFVRGDSIWLINVNGHHARRVIRNGHQPAWKLGR
jgi:Tol biopolymer transport system component